MKIYIKKHWDTSFSFYEKDIKEIRVVQDDNTSVEITKDAVFIKVNGDNFVQYFFDDYKKIAKKKDPDSEIKISGDLQNTRVTIKETAKERMELDPIDSFWNAVIENIRNSIKYFFGDKPL